MAKNFRQNLFQGVKSIPLALVLMLALPSQVLAAEWGKNFGGYNGANVRTQAVAVDGSGNVYLAGQFTSLTLTLGAVTLNRIGTQDVFVVKMDSSGTVLWAKNYGGAGVTANGNAIAVDGSGNVYVGGNFNNANLTTPALTRIGITDAFAIKLDSSGNTTWAKNFGGVGAIAYGNAIAVDGGGNVYLGGSFNWANLTTPALTMIGDSDAFAFKLDSSGNTTWAKNFGGAGAMAAGSSIAVDSSNNVYLGGNFQNGHLTTPALTKIGVIDPFAFKLDSSGNTTWAKNFGGMGAFAWGRAIAVDGSGNVYLAGYFFSMNLTTPALTKIGNTDAFAIKLDSSGNITWAKNYGGAVAMASCSRIAVDGSGNVYLSGSFSVADLTTPALTRIGSGDAFAFKLDSSGNTTWAKNFGGAGAGAESNGLAVDGSGNVYLGGYFQSANLTTPALTKVGNQDAFAFKLDSSGNTTWANSFGALTPSGTIYVTGVAIDSSRNIYFAGYTTALISTFGATNLNRIGTQDAFVVKTDPFGTVLWAKNFGGASANAFGRGIAVDSSGNVYLGGHFDSQNLTTPALTKLGIIDAFTLKLDSNGNTTWAKNFGGAGAFNSGYSIAVDSGGNVYLGGFFDGANLTTPALTKIGVRDAFAFKLDSSGNTTWAKNFGGAGANAWSRAIAVDSSNNVYLGGYFGNNLTTPALTKIGSLDAFALKLDSSGNVTWAKNFGGAGASGWAQAIAVDSSNNVYLAGYFDSQSLTTPALTIIGLQDAFVFKLDSSGNTTWAKNFGGAGANVVGAGISIDSGSNVYLGGSFSAADLTTPLLNKIGVGDALAFKLDSSGNTTWAKNYGGSGASTTSEGLATDGRGNIYLAGHFQTANLTSPALTKIGNTDALIINSKLYSSACTTAGQSKYDAANSVMVFCDGTNWQSMNTSPASTCSGSTAGKFEYYSNGASSDFVWYGGSCRSAKSATTYGGCATNGKWEWDSGNSTIRGCINGTWTSLKGW